MSATVFNFIDLAHCEICGKVKSRRELKWHRLWVNNGCALPTHPEHMTFYNLCSKCYDMIHDLSEAQKAGHQFTVIS